MKWEGEAMMCGCAPRGHRSRESSLVPGPTSCILIISCRASVSFLHPYNSPI